jgi:hypothetical protein
MRRAEQEKEELADVRLADSVAGIKGDPVAQVFLNPLQSTGGRVNRFFGDTKTQLAV